MWTSIRLLYYFPIAQMSSYLQACFKLDLGCLSLVETLRYECEIKLLYEAWQFCGDISKWYTNWPHLMKLWQKILVIPHVLQFVKGVFKTKCYQEPFVSFIEVGQL